MKNLKILQVSYSKSGGAGVVASNLSQGLNDHSKYKSEFCYYTESNVKNKPFENIILTSRVGFDNYVIKNSDWPSLFSYLRNINYDKVTNRLLKFDGILHLHWINGLFDLSKIIEIQKHNKRIVWTMHDMEPFTGGCHNSINCSKFEQSCLECPAVRKFFQRKISNNKKKKDYYFSLLPNLNIVFPSKWLMSKFNASSQNASLNIRSIPNPISNIFFDNSPTVKSLNREPSEEFVLGFISSDLNDPLKQFKSTLETIELFSHLLHIPVKLIAVGSKYKKVPQKINFKLFQPGLIREKKELKKLYSKMDVVISNSFSESFGLTIAESNAVGVPCLVLKGSGSEELIVDKITGLLYNNQIELIKNLLLLANSVPLRKSMGQNAITHAQKNWSLKKVLGQYEELYDEITLNS